MINVKEYPFVIRQDSNSQPPITGSPGLEYKASFNFFSKEWANPGLFSVYFRLFNMLQFKFKLKKA